MNTLSKTILALISGLIIAVAGILLYVYWPAITGTIQNNQYLTPEQGQEMYDKGYADGNKAQEEQIAQIAYYKEITDEYYIQVGILNNEISNLNGQIADKNTVIAELTQIKNSNLQTIADLYGVISNNETRIDELNAQVSGLQFDITNLESQVSSLNSDVANKQVIITGLNSQITELQTDITAKRNQLVNLNSQISDLQAQMAELQNSASANSTQIESLRSQITTLTNEKTDLESAIADKNSQISGLNTQISSLNSQIVDLNSQITAKENTISTLNSQIVSLQTLNNQLSQTNQSNADTIATLNSQIVSLNNQIGTLSLQIQNNSSNVTNLNNRISELEESIAYYENFIAGLQSESQVVATFMYDGSVYNIQVLSKNAYASVTNPNSTTKMIFNGWTVNGQAVNLASYQVSANTTFVADITYKYDVVYKVDNEIVNTQLITKNAYVALPTNPTKTNYQFDGWMVNGVLTTPNTYAITEDTIFVAKFTRLYNVTFTYESTTKSTQTVRNGEYASNVVVENTTYKSFNGWKVDGVIVNVAEYAITQDTIFIADITYKYDVVYQVDNTNYNSQIVVKDSYATLPANPTKNGYEFDGWTLNGNTIINPTTISITANTTFIAKFTKIHTVTFTYENTTKSTQTVRNNEYATNVSVSDTTYKIFNGWKLNGTIVNVANTRITVNTTFVADITYKYDVVFKVDNTNYNTQIVTSGAKATVPNNPSKVGYTFNGWTLNGTDIVNVANTSINANTTFIAKFTINSYSVTFKYESSTLATQTVNYGGKPTNVVANSTNYKVFNGWKNNGTIVDVTTITITGNTEFVADITYRYDVVFKVDNTNYNSQIVTKNNYATVPTNPTKTGYTFNGWTLNGSTVVNVSSTVITQNTTFIAKFTIKTYTVNFLSDGAVYNTQTIQYNNYATVPNNPTKANYDFVGWTLNGSDVVNVANILITENKTFTAKFILSSFNVKFMVDSEVYINTTVPSGQTAGLPTEPTKEGYSFDGWAKDGVKVDVSSYVINENTIFYALFKLRGFSKVNWTDTHLSLNTSKIWSMGDDYYYSDTNDQFKLNKTTSQWERIVWPNYKPTDGEKIWTNGVDYFFSSGTTQYVYDSSLVKWVKKTWTGCGSFDGNNVWMIGDDYYVSNGSTSYKMNADKASWTKITWNGLSSFYGKFVWTDGTNIYHSNGSQQQVLDVATSTWSTKTWNGLTNFSGVNVWKIGTTIYLSNGYSNIHYVLNKATSTWTAVNWNMTGFSGNFIWLYNNNYYFSSGYDHYILDVNNLTWNLLQEPWKGQPRFQGWYVFSYNDNYFLYQTNAYTIDINNRTMTLINDGSLYPTSGSGIWYDGQNYYYDGGSKHYIFNKNTLTWENHTWNGLGDFYSSWVWTDGTNYYYSNGTSQYVLNVSTSTWSAKTWNGLTNFKADGIWTDGTNIYYSSTTTHYMLDKTTSTWMAKTWNGLTNFTGSYVWTDGVDIFYSNGSKQYVLDRSTSTWETKTFIGLTNPDGRYFWTDGDNIYYSNNDDQYVYNR